VTRARHRELLVSERLKPVSDARGPAPSGQPIVLEFDDNRLLALLFGEHDRHLARIEQQLGVSVTPRGNRLMISGPEEGRRDAQTVLSELYGRLEKGGVVEMGDVDGAIRMAQAGQRAGETGGSMSAPVTAKPRERTERGGAAGDRPAPEGAVRTIKRLIIPRSPTQKLYVQALQKHELVFGLGPAGTGKTYLAVAMAVSMLLEGRVDRIILSRPAVEAGERLGFLPGDMREKIDPYLRPLYDALYDMLPPERVVKGLESGEIEVAPLAFMRGRTLSNAYVILDEAQNTSPVQMKMLLTRLGENSRLAVTGDLSQIDLPIGVPSGLRDALDILDGIEGISFVRFGEADVVRHSLVTKIVRAYAQRDNELGLSRPDGSGRPRR
jgi:phosphate starvation-inducible PhoH-like protein